MAALQLRPGLQHLVCKGALALHRVGKELPPLVYK